MAMEPPVKKRKREEEDSYARRPKSSVPLHEHGITQELKIVSYANSHALEIKALKEAVQVQLGGKLVTQKLPRHMRRRAMGHNIKRLPRQIQPFAKGVYANQKGQLRKRPSRYHRRRPKNLLSEYQRRKRKHQWLETHIWHAKRFHMVEKWGFKLPWKPTDKSHRAAYRATKNHCLLQDISYMCCIELTGDPDWLVTRLSHITDSETGCTFAAKACLKGTREGETVIYEMDMYPWKAIGPVSFMWNPQCVQSTDVPKIAGTFAPRTLWIWCHPSIFEYVWNELKQCLELTEEMVDIANTSPAKDGQTEDANGHVDKPILEERFKTQTVALSEDRLTTMKSLTGSILRFRLTGPQSNAVLGDTLTQANVIPISDSANNPDPWWKAYYAREDMALCHGAQREFMEGLEVCQSPAELSTRCIVATTAQDPRLGRPGKRTKIEAKETSGEAEINSSRLKVTADISTSPLWDENIRNHVTQTKLPDYKIAEMKSEILVPGTGLDLGDEESKIPVILIQRPGVTSTKPGGSAPCLGQGSGWDLLLPKAWGMPFWLALVFRGARCGGLLEQECSNYEECSLLFPHNFPDTVAGLKQYLEVEDNLIAKYNRTPPAKRPNFTKLGVPFPYRSPWNLLVTYWSNIEKVIDGNDNILKNMTNSTDGTKLETEPSPKELEIQSNESKNETSFTDIQENEKQPPDQTFSVDRKYFVLRNSRTLRHLFLESTDKVAKYGSKRRQNSEGIQAVFQQIQKSYPHALIPVRIEMLCRGVMNEFAMICIAQNKDLEALGQNKSYSGPLEPKHVDPKLTEKKKLKQDLKQKKISKKVKIDRTLQKLTEDTDVSMDLCSRRIIGFLCKGGYSLGMGTGSGIGFVSAKGLLFLIQNSTLSNHRWTVLVRNNTSLQYRYARMSVVV